MDEIIKSVAQQFPAIAVLLVFTVTLYRDMRTDAKEASRQREESILALKSLKDAVDELAVSLHVTKQ